MHFEGEVDLRFLSDGRHAEVLQDFRFIDTDGVIFKADKGQIVNGASIPRVFWRLIGSPFVGNYRKSAVVHDCEYKSKTKTRKQVDKGFLHSMKLEGVGRIKRKVMYRMVRLFGRRSWNVG